MNYLVEHIGNVKKPNDRKYLAIHSMHPLRLEEVLGLQWRDIDFDNKVIHINRAVTHPERNKPVIKPTKTEASVRAVWLTDTAASYLKPLQGAPDEFVIGGQEPISCQQVWRMREQIAKDIDFDEKITPKRMRPTVLTDLYNKTKDVKLVQAAAGHTTAAMTMKHYVNPRENVIKAGWVIESVYGAEIAKELQEPPSREPA
ncbi:MAG: site-specific integrase [Acutalibacter sp.]|nr:site-specific integrase [Acutalibacter sp.]